MPSKPIPGAARRDMFAVDPKDLVIIGLDTKDGSAHPLYDERINLPLDPRMVANVKKYGVLMPINVRRDGDKLQVLRGRQRVRWARAANVELAAAGEDTWPVECVILKDDERDLPALTLAENEIRVEDSPLVRAKKVERMLQHGHTLDEVALACGKSKATVESWRALLDLDRGIQGKVERGEVSATAVTKLARLPREQQKERLATLEQAAQENPSKRPTVRQTRQPTDHPTPGRRELKAALAVCPPDAVLAIKWVLGDIDAPWPVEKKKKPVEKPTEKKTPTEKPTAAEKPTTQKLTAVLYQA